MITHLSCPKQAKRGTGEERGYNDQSINDESLAKLEMQQSNLGNCLAASFDIGAHGELESCPKLLRRKSYGLYKSGEFLNFSEFITSQSYLWRPDYEEALKHTRRKNKREEDQRFKPPDLNLERHQDITCFILIKE
ncbi:hypothetical protein YC2023_041521 [Brassica napus]